MLIYLSEKFINIKIKADRMKLIFVIGIVALVFLVACAPAEPPIFPSEEVVDAMSPEEKEAAMQRAMEKSPSEEMTQEEKLAEQAMAESMAETDSLKSGSFEGRAHPTTGSARIVEEGGKQLLILSDDFKSDSGPRLHVVLTEHLAPTSSKELHSGDYVDLGKLKSTKGTQTYEIKEPGKYNTVVVYCKPFKVLFGLAKLQ